MDNTTQAEALATLQRAAGVPVDARATAAGGDFHGNMVTGGPSGILVPPTGNRPYPATGGGPIHVGRHRIRHRPPLLRAAAATR